jgi:transglutaminase-like putative cysteine protease
MAATTAPQVQPSSAEKFFQASLYLLLVTGFAALAGTGKLDLPSLAIVIPALLLRARNLLRGITWLIPERWTTWLTIFYFAFYAADYLLISQSFISATVHLVLFSMVVKIFSVQRDRDLLYLAILAFMMVLAAAVLTVDTLFLLTFSLFLLLAIATFISMEMRRSERASLATAVPVREDRRFQRSLSGIAAVLGMSTFIGAALIFFVLPRVSSGGYLQSLGAQGELVSGFSQDVHLGGIGRIQQSNAVVMHVQVLSGKMSQDVKWRGVALSNFDGQHWWNDPGEQQEFHSLGNSTVDLNQIRFGRSSLYSGTTSIRHLPTFAYKAIMEPVGVDVFFLASMPVKVSGNYRAISVHPDGSVLNSPHSVAALFGSAGDNPQTIGIYFGEADTRNPEPLVRNSTSQDYPPHVAMLDMQLPHLDPRIPALARQITGDSTSNYLRAKAIESYLKNNYGYTLQLPGGHQSDPLAVFLFERKKGHCEYFASSMAVMVRALGIPARVVNGFRGGQYNDVTASYIIRERDAHSWVEVYFPEYGWVTFDPTPSASQQAPPSGTWERAALYADAVRELWREWIINYDFSHQIRLTTAVATQTSKAQVRTRLWLRIKYRHILARVRQWQHQAEHMPARNVILLSVALLLLLLSPFVPKVWRTLEHKRLLRNPQRAPRTAASFWYLQMLRALERRGFQKAPAQTPSEFAASIPDLSLHRGVMAFTEHYQRARFAESAEDARRLPELYATLTAQK